ncbi:MAG TPA: DUF4396 domain-containing protein [Terriglobales bacterium]|nr:DUF4396 domain-containing protein [Terriglobales bacterium]
MKPYPEWLHLLAWVYLGLCTAIALWIVFDILSGRRQRMWIMHLVWPITAMYFGPVAAWLYVRSRPVSVASSPRPDEHTKEHMQQMEPTREQVSIADFHCGAGCTIGDILGEGGLFLIGGSVATFVAGSEFATKLVVDFVLAYALGIFFQYFTIVPMRGLSPGKGILAAMRADTISIAAFEIGMFAWMALTRFVFFPEPTRIHPNMAVFWFMMQIAMIVGWATAYPANVWLLRKGWKEKMPMYPSMHAMQQHKLPRAA